ncbi:MAG TPA: MazG nucleotide pyrophosphohydrolase domain-containing protein [Candidatus Saccharimonadales bacterium]|nr:MazG nucleotide pyrophosphohydrolase domain-containing protein [Candidatus Saccharimonadales bacterium]
MSNLTLPKHPTIADLQQYVRDMVIERGFTDQTVLQEYLMLTEEVGELAKCIRKSHANMRIDAKKKYELDAAGEIADILIVLTTIANKMGIDMEKAFREKEEINKQRVWQ